MVNLSPQSGRPADWKRRGECRDEDEDSKGRREVSTAIVHQQHSGGDERRADRQGQCNRGSVFMRLDRILLDATHLADRSCGVLTGEIDHRHHRADRQQQYERKPDQIPAAAEQSRRRRNRAKKAEHRGKVRQDKVKVRGIHR